LLGVRGTNARVGVDRRSPGQSRGSGIALPIGASYRVGKKVITREDYPDRDATCRTSRPDRMGNIRPSVPKTAMPPRALLRAGGVRGLHAARNPRFAVGLAPAMGLLILFSYPHLTRAKVVKSNVEIGEVLTRLAPQSTEQDNPREIERRRQLRVDRLLDIATAHLELMRRVVGKAGNEHFGGCVTACYDALEDATREESPREWTRIQNVVGLALKEQCLRIEGAAGTDLLSQAVAVYRDVLELNPREQFPREWSITMANLAGALVEQGKRAAGAKSNELLGQAVSFYRSALAVVRREQLPDK
jgi:hypothetical protein